MRTFLLLSFVLTASLAGQPAQDRVLTWRGCGISKKAYMEDAARAYSQETGVQIKLSGGGATLGIQAAGEGGADLGGTCRHCLKVKPEKDLPLALTMVAWDALAVIAHPSNPVEGVTVQQLKRVLSQEIINWKALGGPDLPIIVVAREGKISGVGAMMREQILDDVEFKLGPRVIRLKSSSPVEKLVEKVPGALAVTGISSARLRKVKHLSLDGFAPTFEAIATGGYPYYRPLYIAHLPDLGKEAALFREWLLGPRGQKSIADSGTVNLAQGLGLMGRFKAFGNIKQITNYADLMRRYRDAEAASGRHLPTGK